MEFKDYYATLGVEREAKPDDIKRAYRKLARKYHPDVSKEPEAEARFKELTEAYEVLRDTEKRAAYDEVGGRWRGGDGEFTPPPGWDTGFEFSGRDFGEGLDHSAFFEALFGHARAHAARAQAQGADHRARVMIDLEDAYRGAQRSVSLHMPVLDKDGMPRRPALHLHPHRPRRAAAAEHPADGEPRGPRPRVPDRPAAHRRRGPGAHGVHRRRAHPGAPDGAGPSGTGRRPGGARADRLLTRGFERPADFLVRQLAEGVGTIAAAFYPKPVIVRLSDFKTNEYASLLGGRAFEPHEENPMLGFRGAARYAHPACADGFALECAAMKRVRDEMGLTNVKLMVPFCRRVAEAERVLQAMAARGLGRGVNGLEVYVMCEIPNNVIQIDAFARLFDGFSIGSNDLTQLVLGVDRDSEIVAFDFDERDEGVTAMIRQTVEGAHRNGRHVCICGQAPSDYPEMAEYLVELGIDSLSVTPDTLLEVTRGVLAVEQRLGRPPRKENVS